MLRHIHNPNASPEGAQSCISLGYCASGWFQELVLLDKSPSGLGHGNHFLKYMLGVCITCINIYRWEYCQHKWQGSLCRGLAALKFSPHHAKHLLKSRFVESCVWELFFFSTPFSPLKWLQMLQWHVSSVPAPTTMQGEYLELPITIWMTNGKV